MNLQTKTLFAISGIMLLAFGLVEYRGYLLSVESVKAGIYRESKILQGVLVSMRRVYQRVFIEENISVNDKTIRFLPAHSISRIAKEYNLLTDDGIWFNSVSDRPRNPQNQADSVELEAMNYFRQNPQATDRFVPFIKPTGEQAYHFSAPLRIVTQCLVCHGEQKNAPASISENYDTAYGYKLDDLRGILSIKLPAQLFQDRLLSELKKELILKTLIFLVSLIIASWMLNRILLKRMKSMNAATVRLSNGDYSVRLNREADQDMDQVSLAFNSMAENIGKRETELKESREAYRTVINNMEDVLFRIDINGCWEFLSPAWEKLTGNSVESSLARHWSEFVDPVDHDRCVKLFSDQAIAREEHCVAEFKLNSINSDFVDVEAISRAIADDDGIPLAISGVIRNISRRKQAEKQQLLAAKIVESTVEGVIIADADVNIVSVNPAFTEITGYSEQEVIGRNPSFLHSGQHKNPFFIEMWSSIKAKGYWQGEIWNRRKSGELYPEWLTINTLKDETGKLTNYVGVFGDISAIKETQQRLEYLSHHDPLTNLPNRMLFQLRLEHAIHRASRSKVNMALLFIDLDNFKEVNDSLGHAVGDKLLQSASTILKEIVRQGDTVARQGGDEFLILVEQIDQPQDAALVAEKILERFRKPFAIDGHELFVSSSIGISIYPEQGENVDTLIKNADAAMYRAKDLGRNGFQYFSDTLTAIAKERQKLQVDLRHALNREEFRLYYQPQIELSSNQIVGMEALIRWEHPQTGLVSPNQFIPFAEESGLIEPIGKWVLFEACRQAVEWQRAGLPALKMSVNLSARQLTQADIVSQVQQILQISGLDAGYLELEITESMLMENAEQAIHTLNALKSLGVDLAIDDFGTGYSSLSYLKRFPVDKLKIDREFVRDLPGDQEDLAITRAIIALGKSMNLHLIAEGVETPQQFELLLAEGCDQMQGYLFSPAVPSAEMKKLLLAQI